MPSSKLNKLHEDLTNRYIDILDTTEDPRLLKEIREFLNDNDINVMTMDNRVPDEANESVDLDDDYIGDYKLA